MAKRVEELFSKEEVKEIIAQESMVEEELEKMAQELKNEDDGDEEFSIDEEIAYLVLGSDVKKVVNEN